jgi:hypothetical protein
MVSKTLYLTGSSSSLGWSFGCDSDPCGNKLKENNTDKLERIQTAVCDQNVESIHVVNQDFDSDAGKRVLIALIAMVHVASDRKWKSVKLMSCKGRGMHLFCDSLLESAKSVQKLVLSTSTRDAEEQQRLFDSLGRGLPGKNNRGLVTSLCVQDMRITADNIKALSMGLSSKPSSSATFCNRNKGVVELSFDQSTFTPDAASVLAREIQYWTSLHHLSFQNCQLNDTECESILLSLSEARSNSALVELCMDGNHCIHRGMNALGKLISNTNIMVLDLSSQTTARRTTGTYLMDHGNGGGAVHDEQDMVMDLTEFCHALASSKTMLCGLQLSDNRIGEKSLVALARALRSNRSLKLLHLAWCSAVRTPNDTDGSSTATSTITPFCQELGRSLFRNPTLTKLVLYECQIDDIGIASLAHGLEHNHSLKRLDVGGKQLFGCNGWKAFAEFLAVNDSVEYVSSRRPVACSDQDSSLAAFDDESDTENPDDMETDEDGMDAEPALMMNLRKKQEDDLSATIEFLCDFNRGGKRFLKFQDRAPSSLWPLVLNRVGTMALPSIRDPFTGSIPEGMNPTLYRKLLKSTRSDVSRRASVMFDLLRNHGSTIFHGH